MKRGARGAFATAAVVGVAAAVVIDLVSAPARALCPNCLGQNDSLSPTMRIVGVFLLVPIAIFFVVARMIRRLSR
jgi:hypothetical protein